MLQGSGTLTPPPGSEEGRGLHPCSDGLKRKAAPHCKPMAWQGLPRGSPWGSLPGWIFVTHADS